MQPDIAPLIDKLRENFAAVEQSLADPSVYADRQRAESLSREHQRLAGVLSTHDSLAKKREELADNREMLGTEEDEEFKSLVEADVESLAAEIEELEKQLMALLLPPGKDDSRNTIVEIRPAAGGDEAALFAGDLFRMYSRFAERRGWQLKTLSQSQTNLGGIKDISFSLQGDNVFRAMQLESGVHRVQRIPSTEGSGRIHTSTVTVAVLPEAQEVEIKIEASDLRMDVFRSSGPGGQSVNTTDSAVRLTHLPTGVTVSSQDEKSQHRNRATAMRILRARIYELKRCEEDAKYAEARRSQVGTGERNERIRTYNFPQNRVTDHRYGLSWHSLPATLDGDLQEMIDDITAVKVERHLEDELAKLGS